MVAGFSTAFNMVSITTNVLHSTVQLMSIQQTRLPHNVE